MKMTHYQQHKVKEKVQYVGPARCDICEIERPEVLEIPFGFFGFINGHICSGCLSACLRMCRRDVG